MAFGFSAAWLFSVFYSNSRAVEPERIVEKAKANIDELERRAGLKPQS